MHHSTGLQVGVHGASPRLCLSPTLPDHTPSLTTLSRHVPAPPRPCPGTPRSMDRTLAQPGKTASPLPAISRMCEGSPAERSLVCVRASVRRRRSAPWRGRAPCNATTLQPVPGIPPVTDTSQQVPASAAVQVRCSRPPWARLHAAHLLSTSLPPCSVAREAPGAASGTSALSTTVASTW